jgi:hypothetical protein
MSKNQNNRDFLKNQSALKRLLEDLSGLDNITIRKSVRDHEMLSFLIEETSNGVDISERYPTFYQKLLNDSDLRQTFLDILESIDNEDESPLGAIQAVEKVDLGFLKNLGASHFIQKIHGKWKVFWQRSSAELQSAFSPPELLYRSEHSLFMDPWFTLLRDEIELKNTLYTIVLECALSKDDNQAISPLLNIAVAVGETPESVQFPVEITLRWGMYQQSIHVTQEGPIKFPDIPFNNIFEEDNKIKADLLLTLEVIT